MIKILIIDDHQLLREGVKKILREETDFIVAGEASNGPEALNFIMKNEVDVIILDITLPGQNGIELIKSIKKITQKPKILIFSMHPEDRFAVRALKSGAFGYLTKESASEELVNAIRKIYSGHKYISMNLAEQLAQEIDDEYKPIHNYLSDREFEVFRLIASGKKVSYIADKLSLSVPTVNTYRARILEKMRMKSNVELTHYALKNDLLD